MKFRNLFFLVCLVISTEYAYAHYIIKGIVINGEDNSPLPGAVVQIKSEQRGVVTDEFGHFELVLQDHEVVLSVSFIGFEDLELALHDHDNSRITIVMQPSAIQLNQVQISADQINGISTISKIDIRLRPINSSQDILRIIPGLFIAQHAGGGKAEQIFLRGFDTDHGTDIKISVDGLPVNMVSHAHGQGYADLHFLIPELINTVDFGKGPYYADQGNLATAGYASFHTLNTLNKNTLKMELGQYNTLRTMGMFDLLGSTLGLKGHNAYFAAEYCLTDGPFEYPQHFNRVNLFGKYNGYFGDNNLVTVQFSKLQSKWDASGQIPDRAVKSGEITRFGAIDPTEGGFTGRTNASVRLVNNLPSGIVTDNQLYLSNYDFELYSNFTFYLNNPIDGDQIRQKEDRHIYGLIGNVTKSDRWGSAFVMGKIGYGFRYDDVNELELSNTQNRSENLQRKSFGDVDETNSWLFAEGTMEKNRWLLNLAMRADYFKFDYVDKLVAIYKTQSVSTGRVSPKVNVIYKINDQARLYLKSGIGFHSNDTRVVVAEEGRKILPPAYGVDLGTTLKPVPSVYLNFAAWYLFLEQEFVYVGDEAIVEPGGQTARKGLDLSMRWQALPWLFADLDVNYSNGIYPGEEKGNNYIPLAPIWTSIGGLTFQTSGLSGSLRYRYMKDRPANEDNSVVALGYGIINLKVNYTRSFYDFGFMIENLFDAEWNEAQFATESRLYHELTPVEELHYTPGVPFFLKISAAFFF